MKSRLTAGAAAAAALGIALTGSFVAHANWNTQSPSVSVKIRAARMPRGGTPSVTVVDNKAVVSWRAQKVASGVMVTSYVVTAHRWAGPAPRDVTLTWPATGGPAEKVTFAVGGGKWTWTIVPRLGSWAGRRSAPTRPLTFPAANVPAVPDPIPSPSPSTAEQGIVGSLPEPSAEPTMSPEAQTVPSVPTPTPSASAASSAVTADPVTL